MALQLSSTNIFIPHSENKNQVIFSLSQAVSYFINKNVEKKRLTKVDVVLPEFENIDYTKHSQGDMDIDNQDNKEGCYVQQQYPVNHERKASIAYIFSEDIKSPLGTADKYFYFVVYRKKLTAKWSKMLNLKAYSHKQGVVIPVSILRRIYQNKVQERSEIVVVCGDGMIYSAPAKDLIDLYNKKKWHFINSYDQLSTAYPLEEFFVRKHD